MRVLDRTLGGLLILLGCVHNFVAAPLSFIQLDTRTLWFVSGGLALWYAGFINWLRGSVCDPDAQLLWVGVLTNLSLLVFVVAFAALRGHWMEPRSLLLVGIVAVLSVTSCRDLLRRSGGRKGSGDARMAG